MTTKKKILLEEYSALLQKRNKLRTQLKELYQHPRTYKLEIQKKERSLQKVKDAITKLKPLVNEQPKTVKKEVKNNDTTTNKNKKKKVSIDIDIDLLIKAINRVKETELIPYMSKCDDIICKFLGCETDDELTECYNKYKELYLDYWIQSGLLEYLRNDKDYIVAHLNDRPILMKLVLEEV